MEIWVDPRTGLRDRSFRPYIEEEELNVNLGFYSPNGGSINTGFYSIAGEQSCQAFQTQYMNRPVKIPVQFVDNLGRLHRIQPRFPNTYEPLSKNINPNYS